MRRGAEVECWGARFMRRGAEVECWGARFIGHRAVFSWSSASPTILAAPLTYIYAALRKVFAYI